MAAAKDNSNANAHADLKIEPKLLEEARSIVERRDFVEGLLEKAKETDIEVKAAIRAKVTQDYEARLAAVVTELAPVQEKMAQTVQEIRKRETEIRGRLEEVTDQIEEQRFRCSLGEFSTEGGFTCSIFS